MTTSKASFEVKDWQEDEFDSADGAAKLTKASVRKEYSGDITGTSVTEWVMAYSADGSATFVGIERITGAVDGREGTLVLQHVGKFEGKAAVADLTVVSGAGSGGLADVNGAGSLRADPAGHVQLDLD